MPLSYANPAEKPYIDFFTQQRGHSPQTPEEIALVTRMAYPTITQMPEDLRKIVESTLPAAGLESIAGQKQTAWEGLQKSLETLRESKRTTPTFMNTLQEALRLKQGTKEQPIGESEIFKKAGLASYGSLSQSLATRGLEIQKNFADFSNFVKMVWDEKKDENQQLLDESQVALDNYKYISGQYDNLTKRLNELQDQATKYEQQINLLKIKHQNDKELVKLRAGLESSTKKTVPWSITAAKLGIVGLPLSQAQDIFSSPEPPTWFLTQLGEEQGVSYLPYLSEAKTGWEGERGLSYMPKPSIAKTVWDEWRQEALRATEETETSLEKEKRLEEEKQDDYDKMRSIIVKNPDKTFAPLKALIEEETRLSSGEIEDYLNGVGYYEE
jgi:hypothetical protein